MKYFFSVLICTGLLLSAAPADPESWTARVIEWFTGLFGSEDTEERAQEISLAEAERINATPLGKLLAELPDSDTLAINNNWPLPSLNIAADLDRRQRLLEQTKLLTDASKQLPISVEEGVRIIYRSDQRPFRFIEMARRFTSVQEVAYGDLLDAALTVARPLTTIVVVDDPPGASSFNGDWYRKLADNTGNFILVHFGDAGIVLGLPESWTVVNCPLRSKESESFIAQGLFGAETINGGPTEIRKGFRDPELLGIDREKLDRVDNTINRAIRYRATPGAQLLVLREGQVVVERAYGYQSYRKLQEVSPADLYDLASVTKAAATTFAVMKLYDRGELDLKARVRDYLPEFEKRQVGVYRIDQLLTHQTGIQADLPLFPYIGRKYVSDSIHGEFGLPISESRWLATTVPGMIRKDLQRVDYTKRSIYRYSDINFVLLQYIVEQISGQSLDAFVTENFYRPLRLGRLAFKPADRFPFNRMIPTVEDVWMRGGLLRGYVHDEGAALLGGVAGHAGLFGNARDLAMLFQLLNDGGGDILSPETVALFTDRGPYNYRALGFDRLVGGYSTVIGAGASERTFGHTGFSGTCVWADPENDLVFVLLTNRIHPDPKNVRLMDYHTRTRVHRDVYRALGSFAGDPV